jgi:hypothetical protein
MIKAITSTRLANGKKYWMMDGILCGRECQVSMPFSWPNEACQAVPELILFKMPQER